ncbi:MAG: phenylalanine--tRNA ligase subunit beta [Actinomycetota bacterium]|nr:phenylalanine--tRNA ligase subunit beta [Actinomycetota bacterium]
MKVLLSWMQEFAPIEGDPHELAATLTDLGLVVESVESTGPAWDGIIVARILELRPHPEANRIQLVDLDTGGAASAPGEPLQICCGAFNMAVGDLVPLATLGTIMPNGLEIARRKLRGQWSNGMLCSAAELELADDAEGIRILDARLTVGQPLAEALGAQKDWLFDIDVEGNRPDALSVAGVARDLAARLGVAFSYPPLELVEGAVRTEHLAAVEVLDDDLCARFGVRVLENVTVGPSPAWMAARLAACGVRSINNVVDISNYVMLELGEPNHTYDLDLVPDGALRVRMARDGERLITLDDQVRRLTTADGLICNQQDEPIGLAGVMGGASTEISEKTTRVLLEAAVWDRMTIARTSRRLGLRSEASTRFERGTDPLGIERALDRFCALAVEHCGVTLTSGSVVVEGGFEVKPPVRLRVRRVNHLLNTSLDAEAIRGYLEPIGFRCALVDGEPGWLVTVPTWRPDSQIEEDLVEEIGRHHGYSRSGKRVPRPSQNGELTPAQSARRRIRRTLLGAGLSEAMPMPFLAPGDLAAAGLVDEGEQSAISLENPLVAEESILRISLLPGLLKAVMYNQSHRNTGVQLYELGRVFLRGPEGSELPTETERVGVILADQSAVEATKLLHRVAAGLGLRDLKAVNRPLPGLHPTRSAEVVFRGRTMGEVGEVDPRVLQRYGIAGRAGWLSFDIAPVLVALNTNASYKRVSNYPSSDIDLAFVVADSVSVNDLVATLTAAGRPLLQRVRFLNAFRSDNIGAGLRSVAFSMRLQAPDRTLTDIDVATVREALIDAARKKNKAELR